MGVLKSVPARQSHRFGEQPASAAGSEEVGHSNESLSNSVRLGGHHWRSTLRRPMNSAIGRQLARLFLFS